MTRDVIADIKENDIVLNGRQGNQTVFYNVIWGKILETDDESYLYANVIIPIKYLSTIAYDKETLLYTCYVKIPYFPQSRNFRVRFVTESGGNYQIIDSKNTAVPNNIQAYTYAFNKILPKKVNAAQLPFININGEFLICIKKVQNDNFNRAYIYSADETDLEVGFSDDQAAQLLAICGVGKYYRYPTTGVGITDYVNSVVSHTDLGSKLTDQFQRNQMPIQSADFDAESGNLDTVFSNESDPSPDTNLTPKDKLDIELLRIADDEYIRRMQNVSADAESGEYLDTVLKYDMLFDLYFCNDSTSTMIRLEENVENGIIKPDGSIVEGTEDELVISTRIRFESVIAFELPDYNYDAHPSFVLIHPDTGEILYKSCVGEKYLVRDNCKKCGVALVDAIIKYGISKADYEAGHGLFLISKTEENWKNLLSVVTDNITGRLIGIITSSSNIVDAVLDIKNNNLLIMKQNIE